MVLFYFLKTTYLYGTIIYNSVHHHSNLSNEHMFTLFLSSRRSSDLLLLEQQILERGSEEGHRPYHHQRLSMVHFLSPGEEGHLSVQTHVECCVKVNSKQADNSPVGWMSA